MPAYIAPGQSVVSPTWGLVIAMIAASGFRPWVWAGLVIVGVVVDRKR